MVKFEIDKMVFCSTFQEKPLRFTRVSMQIKLFSYQYRDVVDISGHNVGAEKIKEVKWAMIKKFIKNNFQIK